MASVINVITKEIKRSVHTPYYPEPYWMVMDGINLPDCDKKYWIIENKNIREMTIEEKNILIADEAAIKAEIDQLKIDKIESDSIINEEKRIADLAAFIKLSDEDKLLFLYNRGMF